ncbi:MAG TPA: hypothetical protein VK658_25945 [Chryseolinea sp.]|nr:hypothetical protein [Chryseolinea sp.]
MKILFYLLLLGSHVLLAQDLKWNEGSIVLRSGTVITGKIHLTPGQNLILFKGRHQSEDWRQEVSEGGSQVQAFPAHKLTAVFFYDEEADINRRFIAVGERSSFPGIQLYEAVLQGRIDVLRRPRMMTSTSTEARDFDYYCRDHNKLVPLWKFYREVYPALDDALRQQLAAFIKANGLQRGNDANVITIIGYCNKMARAGQPLARY